MRLLQISKLGHPVLRTPCEPVPAADVLLPAFQEFVDDMVGTMRENQGAGLAAPQVFVGRRVAVIEASGRERGADKPEHPLLVLINPEFTAVGTTTEEDWEGCLSIDNLRGLVPRHVRIQVKALGRDGKKIAFKSEGFHARVIQHEIDHLNGVLFLDRMTDMTSLMQLSEFARFSRGVEAARRRRE